MGSDAPAMMVAAPCPRTEALRAMIGAIPDPEIPAVTLSDLGILRDVHVDSQGPGWDGSGVTVVLTPTYSGCPATELIQQQVRSVLQLQGLSRACIRLQLAPAWTSDWISAEGRRKLRDYGIAPPSGLAAVHERVVQFRPLPSQDEPTCPRCSSPNTERLSQYGSTPCKALYRCLSCREPFDYFKPY